jgi:creatinine amidohydrolase
MILPARGALFRSMHDMSGGTGVVGDPSLATREKGEQITAAVVEQLAHVVETIRQR